MIAYVETRLELEFAIHDYVFYATSKPGAVVEAVRVRRDVFEGEVPQEIILTVTPA